MWCAAWKWPMRTSPAACGLGAHWELTGALPGALQELTSPGKGWCPPQEEATTVDGVGQRERDHLLGRGVVWCHQPWSPDGLSVNAVIFHGL